MCTWFAYTCTYMYVSICTYKYTSCIVVSTPALTIMHMHSRIHAWISRVTFMYIHTHTYAHTLHTENDCICTSRSHLHNNQIYIHTYVYHTLVHICKYTYTHISYIRMLI